MRVLIVEDEQDTPAALARGLGREGLAVDVAADGRQALVKAGLNERIGLEGPHDELRELAGAFEI
jgi:DNA-binding response OmpR family regulator